MTRTATKGFMIMILSLNIYMDNDKTARSVVS